MISKSHRLPLSGNVPFRGQRLKGASCHAIVARSNHAHYRLAIIAGKKVSLKAVVRHRLKRIVAAHLSHIMANMPSIDCLVIILPSAVGMLPAAIRKDLDIMFAGMGVDGNA